ncbi:MAG TPA: hypothetical protein VJH69_01870 [Candidatus Paceibacterota bacterium]
MPTLPAQVTTDVAEALIAQGAGSQIANIMCASYTYVEGYRYCYDVTFGIPTPGMCIATATCLGLGTVAITGAAIGLGKGIVEGIMKGQPGANVTSGVPTYGGFTGYSPYISGGTTAPSPSSYFSQDISNLLSGIFGSGSSISPSLLPPQIPGPQTPAFAPQPAIIPPSTSKIKSDVFVNHTGATIQAGVSDAERNIEFVAFFGANVPRLTDPENVVARHCIVRPWQNPLISYVIPYPIFDKLCNARKMIVGVPLPPPPPPPVKKAAVASAPATPTAATSTTTVILAKTDIWAVPATVASGERTSIFWNASGVVGCDLRGSDGIFSGDTISGSAASAPITGPTVFAISCLTADDVRVSNSVTVKVGK